MVIGGHQPQHSWESKLGRSKTTKPPKDKLCTAVQLCQKSWLSTSTEATGAPCPGTGFEPSAFGREKDTVPEAQKAQ